MDVANSPMDPAMTAYLQPVKLEYMKKLNAAKESDTIEEFQVSCKLKESLFHYIWNPEVFKCPRPMLDRIYREVSAKFRVDPKQTDFDDLLKYHSTELVSSMFIRVVVGMAMIEPRVVAEDVKYLEELLEKEPICLDNGAVQAYNFVLQSLKRLFQLFTADESALPVASVQSVEGVPDYESLSGESQSIIGGLSALYMKVFRAKPKERLDRLKKVAENVTSIDWTLYVSEALRLKRREAKFKKPTDEEMKFTERSLQMERDNPFVMLNLIDCVIDAVREWNGRFHCGDIIHLHDTDQAMHFLKEECEKLCESFPKNVHFLSMVADYFARYVPYLHFDKELSGRLLNEAYKLNPENAKTTHRLSIFHRMNLKNAAASLEWLKKTLELDPSHVNANMDYLKSVLGQPDVYENLGKAMEDKLNDEKAFGWREQEKNEFQFYVGLAYFAEGKYDDTLRLWMEVMKKSELLFSLSDVDLDCSLFRWNSNFISTDKIRQRIQTENEKDSEKDENKKECLRRMFHLMLGICQPKRLDPLSGPYTGFFTDTFHEKKNRMSIPATQR